MQQQNDLGREAAVRASQHAQAAATAAGLAAGAAAEALGVAVGAVSVAAAGGGREVARAVRSGADLVPAPEALEGVLEDAYERGAQAWDVLRGRRAPRRWPRTAGGAAVGAMVAVVLTVLVRRLATRDAPGAQDPEQVLAVVDLAPAVPLGTSVDEDGEVVEPA